MLRRSLSFTQSFVARLVGKFGHVAGLVLAARILQNINGFLLSVLIVRRFGLAGAGTLAIATVAIVVMALISTFGLTYTLARMQISTPKKNTIGLLACIATLPACLPLAILLGLAAGQNHQEAAVIAVLALGGPFFAQTNIANALQVLQGKAGDCVIPPIGNMLGLIAAAAFGSSFLMFAALLAAFRFASIAVVFLRLPRGRLPLREVLEHLAEGLRFLTADAVNLGSDQVTVLIVSYLISRGELGLFGLCRQMLTVSDTPGWSQLQASYPAIVADPQGQIPKLRRRLMVTGVLCAVVVAALTVPLGLWVYHLPGFMILGPLLQTSTPVRYLLGVYDTRLRAIGAVARSNRVSLIRGLLALLIIPMGAWMAGATGAVVATILHVCIATYITSCVRTDDVMAVSNKTLTIAGSVS
jgi:O-antigen/teichoic acid export membrane protein